MIMVIETIASDRVLYVFWVDDLEDMSMLDQERSLAKKFPELADEWDYEKNAPLTPDMVSYGTARIVFWKCSKHNHSFEASVNNRTANRAGCPYCSGHRVLAGFNDLQTLRPDLAAEWHPTANDDLQPSMLTTGSNRKVAWICQQNHLYWATITNRVSGKGCPYCSGHKVLGEFNSLAKTHPAIAAEWHPTKNAPLTAEMITFGSTKKVWWVCQNGHTYSATPNNRSQGKGCPFCSNTRVLAGYNDLETVYPQMAAEWNYSKNQSLKPNMVFPYSKRKVWWICPACKMEYQASIGNRIKGNSCPNCVSRQKTSFAEQTIFYYVSLVYPDAINRYRGLLKNQMELDIYIPSIGVGIEYDGIAWHSNKAAHERDRVKYLECKKHGIKLIRVGEDATPLSNNCDDYIFCEAYQRDLTKLDKVMDRLSLLFPLPLVFCTQKDEAAIRTRYYHNIGERSLDNTNPELVLEWDYSKNKGLYPTMFSKGSGTVVWWVCSRGHSWEAAIVNRSKGSGCPYCSGNRVVLGETDLRTCFPKLSSEWDYQRNFPLVPERFTSGSQKSIWWICSNGHSWRSTISNRAKGKGCPYCANVKVMKGFNDLEFVHPEIAAEWNYFRNGELHPDQVQAGSAKKVWWICAHSHEWQAEVRMRVKGMGCPYCANKSVLAGFNDLASTNSQLSEEWHPVANLPLKPSMITSGSSKKVWWKCKVCGYEWQAVVHSRNNGRGCPACARKKLRGE